MKSFYERVVVAAGVEKMDWLVTSYTPFTISGSHTGVRLRLCKRWSVAFDENKAEVDVITEWECIPNDIKRWGGKVKTLSEMLVPVGCLGIYGESCEEEI